MSGSYTTTFATQTDLSIYSPTGSYTQALSTRDFGLPANGQLLDGTCESSHLPTGCRGGGGCHFADDSFARGLREKDIGGWQVAAPRRWARSPTGCLSKRFVSWDKRGEAAVDLEWQSRWTAVCSSCPKSGAGPGSRLPSSRLVGRDTRRSDQQRLKVADDSPPLTFSPPFVPSLPSARRHLFTLRFATPRSDTISSLGDSSGTFTVSHIVSPSGMALRRRLESRWNEYVNQPQQQQQAAQPQAVDSSFFFKANSAACSHTQCPVPGQVGVFEVRSR